MVLMELQLGLALPSSDGYVGAQQQQQQQRRRRHGLDLDLNVNGFGHGGDETMEEAVGSNRFDPGLSLEEEECEYERGDCERSVPRTLPLLFGTQNHEAEEADDDGEGHRHFSGDKESTYLKVTMEGVGIGRKIDLSLHRSLHSLMYTLTNMFGLCYEESENLKLAYQDRDGDWVFAENVTWRCFVRSAQRLKLLRMSG
ncbi:auxin-responsive protein IAA30-like [Rhodamnia argentea]|uniref:Auxin-responsive protein n=1 Tax=Rhodamnia argentea TaxID=178133 RepID=A0A8B8MMI6_9MYRT|nr:auxin-responsive protein IAA30-like [Rhodamnia argentea]